jgi:hypothetical protein
MFYPCLAVCKVLEGCGRVVDCFEESRVLIQKGGRGGCWSGCTGTWQLGAHLPAVRRVAVASRGQRTEVRADLEIVRRVESRSSKSSFGTQAMEWMVQS